MKSSARPPTKIGYARVSTSDQTLNLQRDALKEAGCARIFTDRGLSGSVASRPGLDRALASLRSGDTLIVWKLDRLGRSLAHLVQTITVLGERGVNFRSLSDPIDTQSPGGRLVLHIMGAIAEFERSLVIERTRAGLEAARRRGRKLGRRRLLTSKDVTLARRLLGAGATRAAVARRFGVSLSTLCLAISREKTGRY
jgi:DNA invertase Pin-like site-specific DNA recombinase